MYQARCVGAARSLLHEALFVRGERARSEAMDYLRTLVQNVGSEVAASTEAIAADMLPMPEDALAERWVVECLPFVRTVNGLVAP